MHTYNGISEHSWKKTVQLLLTVVTKKMLNIELSKILRVLMEFTYIKTFPNFTANLDGYLAIYADDEFDSLLVL